MQQTNSESSALLNHVLSQTKANLEFLVSQNYISNTDASGIISKLSTLESSNGGISSITDRTRQLNLNTNSERPSSPPRAMLPMRRPVPPPLAPRVQQARALWDYNADGSEPNDLSFRSGDIIEIISETNTDWWTGKHNGRQGLFPSNYVEKIASRSVSPMPPVPVPPQRSESSFTSSYSSPPPFPSHSAYSTPPPQWQPPVGPLPQPYGGYHQPPPPMLDEKKQQPVVYAQPPPPPVQQPPMQAPPPQEPKKGKLGGFGNTLAHSAVGGVGFGAGAAIGSGIIDAIF